MRNKDIAISKDALESKDITDNKDAVTLNINTIKNNNSTHQYRIL